MLEKYYDLITMCPNFSNEQPSRVFFGNAYMGVIYEIHSSVNDTENTCLFF